MARVRLNLRNLSVTDKIAKGRRIVAAMTNNASFPNPSPPLTEVTAATDELDKAFASVQAAKSELATRVVLHENAETKVGQVLTQLAGYVESVAGKDDTLITGAGMETKTSRSAPTVLMEAAYRSGPIQFRCESGERQEISAADVTWTNIRSLNAGIEYRNACFRWTDTNIVASYCHQIGIPRSNSEITHRVTTKKRVLAKREL